MTTKTPFIIPLFALLSALSLMLLGGEIIETPLWSIAALIYYIALCFVVMKYYPAAFVLLLWFIFIRATTMVSGIAIEFNGYMPELLITGEPTAAFTRLAAIYTIAILGSIALLNFILKFTPPKHIEDQDSPTPIPWANYIIGGIILLCGFATLIGLKHGFPVFEGIDRVVYWERVSSRFFYFFLGNRSIFAALLGLIVILSTGRQRIAAYATFALIMVLSLLFAEKFTSICLILIFFATPIFLRSAANLKNLTRRIIPLGVVMVIITTPAILVAYGVFEDKGEALQRLQARATSQAQLWYIADQNQDKAFALDLPRIEHNIRAITAKNPEHYARSAPYIGARDFMINHLEKSRYNHYVERGVTLTMATEAYFLKLFGHLGMIPIMMVFMAIYCVYLAYLNYAIMTANPLRLIIAVKVLIWAIFGLNQGYPYFVFGLKPLAVVLAVIALEFVARNSRLPQRWAGFSNAK